MKKTFFQAGWRFWIVIAITLLMFIPSAIIAVLGMLHPLIIGKIGLLLLVAFPLIFSLMYLIQMSTYTIVLSDKGIRSSGQFGWDKLQYPVNIEYSDITKLGLSYTDNKNSLGKKVGVSSHRMKLPCLFLKVYTKDKRKPTNILIEFYSIKQRRQIIDMISDNSNLDITYDLLLANKK